MVKVLTLLCFISFSGWANAQATPEELIGDVSRIYRAAMYHIFYSQPLINQKGGDKSQLFGKEFIDGFKTVYAHKFNQPFPSKNSRLQNILLRSMIAVMEDNRTLIMDKDIGFKGLIPANYAFQLSDMLAKRGSGVKIKFTNITDNIRNLKNVPDPWEITVMEKFKSSTLNKYFDQSSNVEGFPVYRYFVPLELNQFCLDCHGTPKDNPLNQGKKTSQWSNIDMTGFTMENWHLGDFAGGLSVTIYKKDFLELEELCEHHYLSTFTCHFFALE